MFEQLWQDVRLAWRGLGRSKGFAAAAVLTLAVGIAGTTAMFAVIQGVLLRPLPVQEQDRLIVVWKELGGSGHWPFETRDLAVLRDESRLLDGVAGVGYNGALPWAATENGSTSYIRGASITGDFFKVLGVAPFLGRVLTRADDVAGAEPAMVIAYGLWQRRYGGARDVIGRRMSLLDQPFTIVGVAPPDVEYPRGVEAWVTIAGTTLLTDPAFHVSIDVVARLRSGVTAVQARSELTTLLAQLDASAAPGQPQGLTPVTRPYEELVVGDVRTTMLALFGAVGLVLLTASANVANLLLLRGETKRSELAVRAALGASRLRLVRQTLAESGLLALGAGVVGLGATWWTLRALLALVPEELPRIESVRIDPTVVLFTVAVAFVSALLAGLVPAWFSAGADLIKQLRTGGRGASRPAARHGRRILIVTQVALAVTVVAAAGLLMRSLVRLQAVGVDLATDHLTLVPLELPRLKYSERARHLRFLDDVVAQLEASPEIEAATPVNASPLSGTGWDAVFTAEGQGAFESARNPLLNLESIHANYFETFEVDLLGGRAFSDADTDSAPAVAIVSEDVAARVWPGQNPIGRRIKLGAIDSPAAWTTVVGVARPTRYRELAEPKATLYLPATQFLVTAQTLVVRSAAPLNRVAGIVRDRVHAVDQDVHVMRAVPFTELLARPLARPRFAAWLVGVFGTSALLLAAIGLYAVMAAYVRQRSKEIGVRVALGATASNVRGLVLGEGLRLAGVGATIGLAGAIALAPLLRGLLYEVLPLDPATLLAATMLLIGVSAVACYLPARRATRVDPIAALRAL